LRVVIPRPKIRNFAVVTSMPLRRKAKRLLGSRAAGSGRQSAQTFSGNAKVSALGAAVATAPGADWWQGREERAAAQREEYERVADFYERQQRLREATS
jgi:hypothetical protein